MPARITQFTPGEFYHVYNRGNGRQNIFRSDGDRYRFLQAMYLSNNSKPGLSIGFLERHKNSYTLVDIHKLVKERGVLQNPIVKICTDCLMPNHFHFLLQEIEEGGIVNFMQRLGTSFGKYFTTKYDRPGSLFQGRFKTVHIKSNNQLRYILAYINIINPAQLIAPDIKENGIKNFNEIWESVDNYNWSAHQEFMGRRNSILVDKGLLGELYPTREKYSEFVKSILQSKERGFWQTIDGLTNE
ncbi:MAG: transposase [Patescibacteria group bacterium]